MLKSIVEATLYTPAWSQKLEQEKQLQKAGGNTGVNLHNVLSHISVCRRRGIGLTTGFIAPRYNYNYSVSQCTPFTTLQWNSTQGWQRLLSLCSNTTLFWHPLPSIHHCVCLHSQSISLWLHGSGVYNLGPDPIEKLCLGIVVASSFLVAPSSSAVV
jgi:hypothetical protein